MQLLLNGLQPIFERAYCLQWELYHKQHHRVVAELNLTLAVRGPSVLVEVAVENKDPCKGVTAQSRSDCTMF